MSFNKIKYQKHVKWRDLKWFQSDTFKELHKDAYQKLVNSIKKRGYNFALQVCELDNIIYILDGHHRQKVLEMLSEQMDIPEMLPATFIEVKDRKEAAEIVLQHNSRYAKITDEGLYEFQHEYNLDIDDMKNEFELYDIELNYFKNGYIEDNIKEKEISELETCNECPKCGYKW